MMTRRTLREVCERSFRRLGTPALLVCGCVGLLPSVSLAAGPAGVTDAALWLDASQLTGLNNGDQVLLWTDMSGNNNHPGATGSAATYQTSVLNGQPVVRFNPDGNASFNFTRIGGIRTVFWVLKKYADNMPFLLGDFDAYHFHSGASRPQAIWSYEYSAAQYGATKLMGTTVDGTWTPLPTGSYAVLSLVATVDLQANQLTADRTIPGRSWQGDIAEVVIYTRALSAEEEFKVGAYLSTKYGLATAYRPPLYWDNNGSADGFGTASGTWAEPTLGGATQGWSTDNSGGTTPVDTTTTLSDRLSFGFGANGLGAGTVSVAGTVAAGNLLFASSSGAVTLSDGTITLAGTAAIRVDNASATISSALAGAAAGLTKEGTGTLTLSGANSFSGGTTLSGGVLSLGHGSGLGAADKPLTFNGGSLDLNGYAITSSGVNMTGSGSRLVSTGAAGSLAANSITVNNGSVVISNVGVDGRGGTLQVGPGSPASLTLDNATMGNAMLLLGLRYQNGGSLVLTNGARLAIIRVWDYWGQVSAIGNGNSDYSVTVTGTGSLLDYNYDYLRIGLTGSRNQLIISDGGSVINAIFLHIGANGWYGRQNRLVVSGGGSFYMVGGDAYVGSGGSGDNGQNENSLTVEGTNALTGAASLVDLQGSPLTVGTPGTLDNTCNVRAGGVLRCGVLTLDDPSSRLNLDGGVLAVTGLNGVGTNYLFNGGVFFDNGAGSTAVSNALHDASGCSGGLTKLGSGTLTLYAANTYTGPTSVSNGVLSVTGTQVLPTATDVYLWTATGAKLELAFEGTTTVRRLYIDNQLQVRNRVYSAGNRPQVLTGTGFLAVMEGTSGGTLIRML